MQNKTSIIICQGSSCFSRGNKNNLQVIQQFLKDRNLTANVSFKGQLCSSFCKEGPVIIINNTTYKNLDEVKTLEIIKNHFN